ncbi:RNA binding protein, putative [Babesia ovis]|uniref:RNA binding protein, putative n=1 Tax=Babesia ovis TaxID=5869 RepID=A0A9W5T882_BABOV|nr:RNA binding protein, putative [Babesia ovis]
MTSSSESSSSLESSESSTAFFSGTLSLPAAFLVAAEAFVAAALVAGLATSVLPLVGLLAAGFVASVLPLAALPVEGLVTAGLTGAPLATTSKSVSELESEESDAATTVEAGLLTTCSGDSLSLLESLSLVPKENQERFFSAVFDLPDLAEALWPFTAATSVSVVIRYYSLNAI